ncbi:MAG: phosphoglycerate kinase [Planctomycetota bacterium]|jgi:phosphoglycerate kinase
MTARVTALDALPVDGRTVLVRVDFNVPLGADGAIRDDTRIRAALPTLRNILERGGRPVCLTHMGRPKGKVVESMRVTVVGVRLAELLGVTVSTLRGSVGQAAADGIAACPAGGVVLLENVRFHAGETKGDDALAQQYAALGDCFVNDAFGACHRSHASVTGIAAHLPCASGLLLQRELDAFQRVLENPERPLVAILGGAKVSDKLKVINSLLERVDAILVGGGMAYTFLKAQGIPIGNSLVEDDLLDLCRDALKKAEERGVELLLPQDHLAADNFAADADVLVCGPGIPEGRMGLDIGPKASVDYVQRVLDAKTVVWNGPMGVFEMEAFRGGTEAVGQALGQASAYTVVGGGDSVAAINLLGLADVVDHVSTGGGASLQLLEGGVLPGIAALQG